MNNFPRDFEYVVYGTCATSNVDFVFERLGKCTLKEAEAGLALAWQGDHECLNMWLELE